MRDDKRFYNFDGLRFFAAIVVVVTHTESIKEVFGYPSLYNDWFFSYTAPLAVTFFFVLSGFLIAFLLLRELRKNTNEKVSLSTFYRNRALKIWPLYYLVVLLAFVLLPHITMFKYPNFDASFLQKNTASFAGYLLFLPNYSEYRFGNVLYLGQLWSLGLEEFFYLLFPLGFYFVAPKKLLYYFIAIVIVSAVITTLSKLWCSADDLQIPLACIYISRYKLYAFALGALSAYLYLKTRSSTVIAALKQRLQITGKILFYITVALLFSKINLGPFTHPAYAVLFATILFLFTVSDVNIRLLNHPCIVYLGKISYGIYMLHPIAIIAAIQLFHVQTGNMILNVLLLDFVVITLTVLLSVISYNCFEKIFFSLRKHKHAAIKIKNA